MKKFMYMLPVVLSLMLCACSNNIIDKSKNINSNIADETYDTSNTAVNATAQQSDTPSAPITITVDEFTEIIDGIWIEVESASELGYEPGYMFTFYMFDKGTVVKGSYPGGYDREGNIVGVTKDDNQYKVNINYPGGIDEWGDSVEEMNKTMDIKLENGTFTFEGQPGIYVYLGEKLDTKLAFKKIEEYNNVNATSSYDEAVELVLNREIFIFKDSFSDIYTAAVKDIHTTKAYKENWKIRQLLNEDNFSDIKWATENYGDAKIVKFSAISKLNNGSVSFEFYLQNGSIAPMAWSFIADGDTKINLQTSINQGFSEDMAMVITDASICVMMVVFCENAI